MKNPKWNTIKLKISYQWMVHAFQTIFTHNHRRTHHECNEFLSRKTKKNKLNIYLNLCVQSGHSDTHFRCGWLQMHFSIAQQSKIFILQIFNVYLRNASVVYGIYNTMKDWNDAIHHKMNRNKNLLLLNFYFLVWYLVVLVWFDCHQWHVLTLMEARNTRILIYVVCTCTRMSENATNLCVYEHWAQQQWTMVTCMSVWVFDFYEFCH